MPRKVVPCHCGKIIKSELNLPASVGLDFTASWFKQRVDSLCECEPNYTTVCTLWMDSYKPPGHHRVLSDWLVQYVEDKSTLYLSIYLIYCKHMIKLPPHDFTYYGQIEMFSHQLGCCTHEDSVWLPGLLVSTPPHVTLEVTSKPGLKIRHLRQQRNMSNKCSLKLKSSRKIF